MMQTSNHANQTGANMFKVKSKTQVEKLANRIADAIVDLVERNNGPVTFARIAREIPGFAKNEPPAWEYYLERDGGETVIWDGMTEAGFTALRKVMSERRVAVQYVNSLLYILEDCVIDNDRWLPIVLLPARAANLDTPRWHVRCSQAYRDHCITMPGQSPAHPHRGALYSRPVLVVKSWEKVSCHGSVSWSKRRPKWLHGPPTPGGSR
jgi:hypothetical protein